MHRAKRLSKAATRLVCFVFLLFVVEVFLVSLIIASITQDGRADNDLGSASSKERGVATVSESTSAASSTSPEIVRADSGMRTDGVTIDPGAALPDTTRPESPANPLPFEVEPDNDVDAETGEPLANAWASTQNPAVGSGAATASPGLPAPLDPSVAPDNDVIVE